MLLTPSQQCLLHLQPRLEDFLPTVTLLGLETPNPSPGGTWTSPTPQCCVSVRAASLFPSWKQMLGLPHFQVCPKSFCNISWFSSSCSVGQDWPCSLLLLPHPRLQVGRAVPFVLGICF